MTTVFPAWDLPTVPVAGTARQFPVRHIYCVGRNYAEHAKEMGGDASKEPPFFFTKAADAILPVVPPAVGRMKYPQATADLHHEIELVVAIGRAGASLDAARALDYVYGYATGLDMTRRDLQNAMREKKRTSASRSRRPRRSRRSTGRPTWAISRAARSGSR
jgi:fumarylpyruvate hydrolase